MATKKKAKAKAVTKTSRDGQRQTTKTPKAPAKSKGPLAPPKAKPQATSVPSETKVKLSMLSAAAKVLVETRRPLTCREIISVMRAKGYWTSPAGKTPEATLQAAVIREIAKKKSESRFKKTAPGMFASARG